MKNRLGRPLAANVQQDTGGGGCTGTSSRRRHNSKAAPSANERTAAAAAGQPRLSPPLTRHIRVSSTLNPTGRHRPTTPCRTMTTTTTTLFFSLSLLSVAALSASALLTAWLPYHNDGSPHFLQPHPSSVHSPGSAHLASFDKLHETERGLHPYDAETSEDGKASGKEEKEKLKKEKEEKEKLEKEKKEKEKLEKEKKEKLEKEKEEKEKLEKEKKEKLEKEEKDKLEKEKEEKEKEKEKEEKEKLEKEKKEKKEKEEKEKLEKEKEEKEKEEKEKEEKEKLEKEKKEKKEKEEKDKLEKEKKEKEKLEKEEKEKEEKDKEEKEEYFNLTSTYLAPASTCFIRQRRYKGKAPPPSKARIESYNPDATRLLSITSPEKCQERCRRSLTKTGQPTAKPCRMFAYLKWQHNHFCYLIASDDVVPPHSDDMESSYTFGPPTCLEDCPRPPDPEVGTLRCPFDEAAKPLLKLDTGFICEVHCPAALDSDPRPRYQCTARGMSTPDQLCHAATPKPVTTAPTEPVTTAPTEPVTTAPTEPVTTAPTEPTSTTATTMTVTVEIGVSATAASGGLVAFAGLIGSTAGLLFWGGEETVNVEAEEKVEQARATLDDQRARTEEARRQAQVLGDAVTRLKAS